MLIWALVVSTYHDARSGASDPSTILLREYTGCKEALEMKTGKYHHVAESVRRSQLRRCSTVLFW